MAEWWTTRGYWVPFDPDDAPDYGYGRETDLVEYGPRPCRYSSPRPAMPAGQGGISPEEDQ